MTLPPDLTELARQLDAVRDDLARALDPDDPATPELPARWGTCAAELVRIADTARWCRDATAVLSTRAGRSWRALQLDTGTPKATWDSRVRRFVDREGQR